MASLVTSHSTLKTQEGDQIFLSQLKYVGLNKIPHKESNRLALEAERVQDKLGSASESYQLIYIFNILTNYSKKQKTKNQKKKNKKKTPTKTKAKTWSCIFRG